MKRYTKKTIEYYNQIANDYFKSDAAQMLKDKINEFINLLPGKRILDVACGPGHDTNYFIKKGFNCLGIDLSEKMIKIAKQNFKGKFKIMDFFNLKFKDNSFDGLWCSSVFTYTIKRDLPELLMNFRKLLKNNGLLGIIATRKRKLKRKRPYTYTLYKKKELENYLKKAGYQLLVSKTFSWGRRKRFFIICKKC